MPNSWRFSAASIHARRMGDKAEAARYAGRAAALVRGVLTTRVRVHSGAALQPLGCQIDFSLTCVAFGTDRGAGFLQTLSTMPTFEAACCRRDTDSGAEVWF